jgi:carboxylesterase type B
MGLLDQYLAIEWVHENIREFGGDPNKVTLMGHSAGAASAIFHMTSPKATYRFQNIILMSGSSLAPWAMGYRVKDASLMMARELGCSTAGVDSIQYCIRNHDTNRIMQAYYRVVDFYNGTDAFGPIIDTFLPKHLQFIARSPLEALEKGEFPRIPVITGISSKDGLLMIKRRPQLYRMTPLQLKETFENEIIPQMLERSGLNRNWLIVKEVVKFAFITPTSNDANAVMDQMLDFFTESNFLAPHILTAQFLSRQSNPVYAYVFDQETPDPHIYSGSINSTGAWHGSILLFLFGRMGFTEQIGKDFNGIERGISTRIQELWTNFIIKGQPSQSRANSWVQWSKFTEFEPNHYWLKDARITQKGYQPYRSQFWTEFLPRLNYIGGNRLGGAYGDPMSEEFREGASPAYRSATWVLVGLVLILMAVLLLTVSVLRRRRKDQEFTSRDTSPEVTGSRSPLPSPSPHPSTRSGRRTRPQDQGVTILY